MVMPRKSGKAAYDEIRLTGSTTECLFISGYTSDLIQRRGDLGATAVLLTKPIQPHLLLSRIAEILHP
jgi:polar amino acid transport system substrate-binding protein